MPKAKSKSQPRPEPSPAMRAKAMEVYERLVQLHGAVPLVPRREPMHELISTMLSHRTNGRNEDLAYARMWERFGSWQAIRDAPLEELAEALTPANFSGAKAINIQATLRRIIEARGEASIDFLREMPTDEAMAWLVALPGVGVKTATLTLLFCFHKTVMPVDTHLHRVDGRIGLIGPKDSAVVAHDILLSLLPDDAYVLFNFHIANLRHGQKICVWGTPRCEQCPLTDICDWYQENRASSDNRASSTPPDES